MTHDEVLMLIISGAVIVEIATMFRYVRRLPHLGLLLCSFGAWVIATVFTVAEGFFWSASLNLLEHLSTMVGAILLALWCGWVFAPRKEEVT